MTDDIRSEETTPADTHAPEPAEPSAASPPVEDKVSALSVQEPAATDEVSAPDTASPAIEHLAAEVSEPPAAEAQSHTNATTDVAPPQEPAAIAAETPAPEPVTTAAEVKTPPSPPAKTGSGDDYSQSFPSLNEGDVVQGTVVHIDREGVLVDVGTKSEGIIRRSELSRDTSIPAEDIVKVGERISVYVMEAENQDGNLILSKKRADFEKAWERVQEAKEKNETIHAMVTDRVKGGLVVDLGIRGFVPASHVGSGSVKNNLDKYVGQSIALKVIEVDKERRKVVLSNKMAADEDRQSRKAETVASLSPDQIRRGIVRRITNYGAFIDLGGIDGLLHISEMSWTRINHPSEVLKEGQELDVMILKMDIEAGRVSLGLRQILPDPWTDIEQRYHVGDLVYGTVSRMVPFGAFVQVEGGIEGIIPNAELNPKKGAKAGGIVQGQEVEVKVIDLRTNERKMTLSLRQARQELETKKEREQVEEYHAQVATEEPRFTIGDALRARKQAEKPNENESDEDEE